MPTFRAHYAQKRTRQGYVDDCSVSTGGESRDNPRRELASGLTREEARLLAAAPTMLAALEFILHATADWPGTMQASIDAIRERANAAVDDAKAASRV